MMMFGIRSEKPVRFREQSAIFGYGRGWFRTSDLSRVKRAIRESLQGMGAANPHGYGDFGSPRSHRSPPPSSVFNANVRNSFGERSPP